MTIDEIAKNLNDLHDYIDETIDGVNELNKVYEIRMKKLEKEVEMMKEEFGEIMFQLQSQLREVIEYEQVTQKETRSKLKKIGSFMMETSKRYRKKIGGPVSPVSSVTTDILSPSEDHK